jgi:L-iditol 2-dehydrogenase
VVLFSGLSAGAEVALDAFRLHYDELTVRGAFHHTPATVRAALAFLASGARQWERLLTHEVSLDGVGTLFADPPRDYIKAIVRP